MRKQEYLPLVWYFLFFGLAVASFGVDNPVTGWLMVACTVLCCVFALVGDWQEEEPDHEPR